MSEHLSWAGEREKSVDSFRVVMRIEQKTGKDRMRKSLTFTGRRKD